ncbi:MAG: polyprenyl synthetase family protein [Lachnospirales bacterium]
MLENEKYLNDVKEKMTLILSSAPKVLKPVMEDLAKAQGKFVRAKVVIETAIALFNKNNNFDDKTIEKVINIGAAIELLHLATLVHDDVIDDAPLRRGIESTQSKYGKKVAVIAGDYLFTKCFTLISNNSIKNMEYFSKAVGVICAGEAFQLEHNMDFDLTYNDYRNIIAGKTAALFSLSMYAVGVELKESDEISERLGRAGYYMGLVFQMVDDCLDYGGEEEKAKKLVIKDLKEGVITYPLIHTFSKKPELKELINKDFSLENITLIIGEVHRLNGVKATMDLAKKYYDLATKKIINSVGKENSNELLGILNKVYIRES